MKRFAWNYCPICGRPLLPQLDENEMRPYCEECVRFYYLNPIPAACCFVKRGDDLLFVQRSVEPCKGLWSLPGGFVEITETTEQAALRELQEETGIVGHGTHLVGANTQTNSHGAIVVLGYYVEKWTGEPQPATDAMAVGFFSRSNRPPLAFPVHRELLAIFDAMEMAFTPSDGV